MKISEFLRFEEKKVILPLILIFLLFFVTFFDSSVGVGDYVSGTASGITDNALNTLVLAVYNDSLNGTEPSIENKLVSELQVSDHYQRESKKLLPLIAVSHASKYILDTFGTNFCPNPALDKLFSIKPECVATSMDISLVSEMARLQLCSFEFSRTVAGDTSTGAIFRSRDVEQIREFVLSDTGQSILDEIEVCNLYSSTLLDHEKMKEIYSKYGLQGNRNLLFLSAEPPKITEFTLNHMMAYIIILAITGYLVSCIILWVHRRNKILYGKDKKVYVTLSVFLVIFLAALPLLKVQDFRLIFILSLILAYITTTFIWKKQSKPKRKAKKSRR